MRCRIARSVLTFKLFVFHRSSSCCSGMMEVLIAEIRIQNVLWNKRNSRYKDILLVDKEWDYVAKSI